MKHIKKRFLMEFNENPVASNPKAEMIKLDKDFNHSILANKKNKVVLIETENNLFYGGFVHKVDGKHYIFPVPDPTLIYFHNAQINIARIKEERKKLIQKIDIEIKLSEPAINEIYNFYSVTSGFVIYLFAAIESFINQLIPDNFVFKRELPQKTELFNQRQIQETLDFKTKITEVISKATGKNFFATNTPTNQRIWNLKDFRNDIIHTKPDDKPLKFEKLIKQSLDFKYKETLYAVASFMNFYKNGYIVECDCGKDF